jgi:hypothetical protein
MVTVSIISPPPWNGGSCVEAPRDGPTGPDAGRADALVAGEGHQVRRRRPHVDGQLRDGLGSVHDDQCADLVRPFGDLGDRG